MFYVEPTHFSLGANLGIGSLGRLAIFPRLQDINPPRRNDTQVQQAFMLQQRLTDVNHPDHTLITYPAGL
ncbi:MAG TPA: hypothetical protein VEH06_14350 [Candidatus Bathyarchaeia archaeon]|nr:hypothetical protein [Candidatus Bathyarchaeia archaeon]